MILILHWPLFYVMKRVHEAKAYLTGSVKVFIYSLKELYIVSICKSDNNGEFYSSTSLSATIVLNALAKIQILAFL